MVGHTEPGCREFVKEGEYEIFLAHLEGAVILHCHLSFLQPSSKFLSHDGKQQTSQRATELRSEPWSKTLPKTYSGVELPYTLAHNIFPCTAKGMRSEWFGTFFARFSSWQGFQYFEVFMLSVAGASGIMEWTPYVAAISKSSL